MNTVSFDTQKCTGCGICTQICPIGNIIMSEKNPAAGAYCLACGHCEASCPENAASVSCEQLLAVEQAGVPGKITPDQLSYYFKMRRSVRNYKQEPVDKETLNKVFDAVRYAPSGVNHQSVKWVLVYNTQALRELTALCMKWIEKEIERKTPMASMLGFEKLAAGYKNGGDPVCRNAPHIAAAYAHKDDRIAPANATIALTHLELLAPVFGLGACWAGYFNIAASMSPELARALGIPEDHTALGTMMLGYPKYIYNRIPKRNKQDIQWK